jgi:PadR family transcriptional regulator PadR
MDAQFKKGLLDVCVLALLSRGESYGWQIIKDLEAVIEISESTLYPVLKRLEDAKELQSYSVAYNGRLRKYFQITERGHGRLRDFEAEKAELERVYSFINECVKGERDE